MSGKKCVTETVADGSVSGKTDNTEDAGITEYASITEDASNTEGTCPGCDSGTDADDPHRDPKTMKFWKNCVLNTIECAGCGENIERNLSGLCVYCIYECNNARHEKMRDWAACEMY